MSILSLLSVMSFGSTYAQTAKEDKTTDVTVQITAGNLSIGINNNETLDFGSFGIPTVATPQTKKFTENFRVEDMEGAEAGYYTTLGMSGDLTSAGGESISAANLAIRATDAISVIDGTTNSNVKVNSTMSSNFASLGGNAVTFIERGQDASGRVGKYGVKPEMELTIPAYQSVGSYSGTLVYTLYENI